MDYKEEIKKALNDFKSPKTIYKQIPNILTSIRAIGVIPINILYFIGNIKGALITSIFVFLTDFFDGKIARKFNLTSPFGEKLDAFCDKIMYLGLSLPLIINFPILVINLFLEGSIAATNYIKYKKGYQIKTNFIGKIKTWFLSSTLAIGYLSLLLNLPIEVLYSFVMATTITQAKTLSKYLNNDIKREKIPNQSEKLLSQTDFSTEENTPKKAIEKDQTEDYSFVFDPNKIPKIEESLPNNPYIKARKK